MPALFRIAITLGLLALGLVGGESSAAACTGPLAPLSSVRAAAYIVVATVTDRVEVSGRGDDWTFNVERVLFGTAPSVLKISGSRSSICSDDIFSQPGDRIVFAHDVRFSGQRLDAYWAFTDGALAASSVRGFGPGDATLAEVVGAIRGAMPDTSAQSIATSDTQTSAPFLYGLVAATTVGLWIAFDGD